MRNLLASIACLLLLPLFSPAAESAAPGYHVAQKIPLTGDAGWDFVTCDDASRTVFVTHGDRVQALDADSGAVKGAVTGLKGVHGVAIATGRGFISDGKDDSVVVFDTSSFKVIETIKVGKSPDAILYDPVSDRVFAFDARSADLSVIDPNTLKLVATVPVAGRPEFGTPDGKGALYLDLEDKGELIKVDTRTLKVLERWKTVGCDEPSAMAIDAARGRIFLGCANKIMEALDSASGKPIATIPIGDGVDAISFDAVRGLVFASTTDGALTVARLDGPDRFAVVETVAIPRRSKTHALDARTYRLFLPTADFGPAPEQKTGEHKRAPMLPGSFAVLVLEAAAPK